MQTTVATVLSCGDQSKEITFCLNGHEVLVKLDSKLVAGIDLLQKAQKGERFEVEYVMVPATDLDAGPIIKRIVGPAS